MIEFLIILAAVLVSCLVAFTPKGSWAETPSRPITPTPSRLKGDPIIRSSYIPQGIQIMTKAEFERFKKKGISFKEYREGKR